MVDLQLSESDVVQPDLVVILHHKVKKITPTKVKVAPDLVVEIMSASTAGYDHSLKLQLYERFLVPEYWIVDPFDQQIERYILVDGRYPLQADSSPVHLSILSEVAIDIDTFW